MPKGYAGLDVSEINPAKSGYCHPAQAKRTKCACGAIMNFFPMRRWRRCECGRVHIKAPGASFGSTGAQPVRPGGKAGCPGCEERASDA